MDIGAKLLEIEKTFQLPAYVGVSIRVGPKNLFDDYLSNTAVMNNCILEIIASFKFEFLNRMQRKPKKLSINNGTIGRPTGLCRKELLRRLLVQVFVGLVSFFPLPG